MKNIKELNKDLEKMRQKAISNLIKAQSEAGDIILEDVKQRAPAKAGRYYDSIKKSNTEKKDNQIHTKIYTDLKSNDGYFIGRMIENGTGIYALEEHIGRTKIFKESEYQYWYVPADKVERPIGKLIIHNGKQYYVARTQRPKPHFKPALESNIHNYGQKIKEAIREAFL